MGLNILVCERSILIKTPYGRLAELGARQGEATDKVWEALLVHLWPVSSCGHKMHIPAGPGCDNVIGNAIRTNAQCRLGQLFPEFACIAAIIFSTSVPMNGFASVGMSENFPSRPRAP